MLGPNNGIALCSSILENGIEPLVLRLIVMNAVKGYQAHFRFRIILIEIAGTIGGGFLILHPGRLHDVPPLDIGSYEFHVRILGSCIVRNVRLGPGLVTLPAVVIAYDIDDFAGPFDLCPRIGIVQIADHRITCMNRIGNIIRIGVIKLDYTLQVPISSVQVGEMKKGQGLFRSRLIPRTTLHPGTQ